MNIVSEKCASFKSHPRRFADTPSEEPSHGAGISTTLGEAAAEGNPRKHADEEDGWEDDESP
jgi:hypothetical protein